RKKRGVRSNADSGLLSAANAYQAYACELRNPGREASVGEILDPRQRLAIGGERQCQDGRVGRIALAVGRRRGQVGRQVRARSVDRLLHLLLGDVNVQVQIELQRDDGGALGTGGRHLLQSGNLPELALKRRGHGGSHHLGAGSRIERGDL